MIKIVKLYHLNLFIYFCFLKVQQAAALGRPMAPGTKLMSPDGVIGVVTQNNNVSLTFPSNYQQRLLQRKKIIEKFMN